MTTVWMTMIAPYRNHRSTDRHGNPEITVLIRIEVAATPAMVSA